MQMKKLLFIIIVLCLISQVIYAQQKQFMWGGIMRSYVVYEPFLDPNPDGYPLVIGLHGTSSSGAGFIATAFLIQKSVKEKFLVACPDGLKYGLFTYFNAGDGYDELTDGTDDFGFISAVIDTMITNYNVDSTRVYVMGFSNGSMMAYRMAAGLSRKIAAIGAESGQMVYELENCKPEFPVPIIHIHGLSDNLVPYEGKGDSILVLPPVDTVLAKWREINDCNSIPDIIYNEQGIIGKKWTSSNGNSDVVLYTIQAMEHQWAYTGTYGISSTDVMWDFLKLHKRTIGTHIEQSDAHSIPENFALYQNHPNPFNPSTRIKYNLPKSSKLTLKIYNLAGQEIETLVNEFQIAGEHEIVWQPSGLPSGLYFYKIHAGDFSETKKLILQK